jgi:hypothetical protein
LISSFKRNNNNKENNMKTALLGLLIFLMGSTSAWAQIEKNQGTGFAGLMAGYADPTNMDGRFGFGADIGMIFPNGVTGLIYVLSSTGEEQGVDIQILHYGLGADYSLSGIFSGPLAGLHGGIRLGMASVEADGNGVSASDSIFTYGPALGYDYTLTPGFSLGGEADLLLSSGDDSVSTLYLLVTGKYWF